MARSTAGACPQFQTARELKIAGKQVPDTWQSGPGLVARWHRREAQTDSPDAATWQRSRVDAFPDNQDAPLLNKVGMRLGATWQWAQVALKQLQLRVGASDAATWRDPTVEARSQYRAAPGIRKAGVWEGDMCH